MKTANEIILKYLFDNKISKTKLARMIDDSPQNLGQKLRLTDITVSLVYRISLALEHDFFMDISKQLNNEIKDKKIKEIQNYKDIDTLTTIVQIAMEQYEKYKKKND